MYYLSHCTGHLWYFMSRAACSCSRCKATTCYCDLDIRDCWPNWTLCRREAEASRWSFLVQEARTVSAIDPFYPVPGKQCSLWSVAQVKMVTYTVLSVPSFLENGSMVLCQSSITDISFFSFSEMWLQNAFELASFFWFWVPPLPWLDHYSLDCESSLLSFPSWHQPSSNFL